jgi:hypothetical protein
MLDTGCRIPDLVIRVHWSKKLLGLGISVLALARIFHTNLPTGLDSSH